MNRQMRTAFAALCFTGAAQAQTRLAVQRVGVPGDFAYPVAVGQPPGESRRLFVAGHGGPIWVVRDGTRLAAPFAVVSVQGGATAEPGLLGMAFHPQFQSNGFVYVCSNATGPSGQAGIVVRRFSTDPANPDVAIAGADQPVFFAVRTAGIHNGGWIGFGPDGFLYISTGESGESSQSQNTVSLLGKMLRIDVDHDDFPADTFRNYAIPLDNPFAASPGAQHEIWAVGLRNPWRCSFDRATGSLWIGDVGEFDAGEIDVQLPGAGGMNYGWPCMEGTSCHSPSSGCTCNAPTLTMPIYDANRTGSATIGGYVYRGAAMPELRGTYIFADYSGAAWSFRYSGGVIGEFVRRTPEIPSMPYSSLGEDNDGELYLCGLFTGVYKVVRGCYANCDAGTTPPVLNVNDFVCFLNQYAAGDARANCDGSTLEPALNALDFGCFLNVFASGCP